VATATTAVASGVGTFSFRVGGGDPVTVAVDATTTLEGLAGAINSATDDAQASVINDGTGYRLVLRSAASGEANTITVTANATSLGLPSGPVAGGQLLQEAQAAVFSIDGLPMTRSSNRVEGAIEGVTITLKNEGTSTLSVTADTTSVRTKIEAFVAAYNAAVTLVSSNSDYDAEAGTGEAFTGESTARDIMTRLRSILGTRVAGLPEALRVFSQVGIKTEKDGTLSIDSSRLDATLSSDPNGVAELFSSGSGVAVSVHGYLDGVTDTISGSIAYRTKTLNTLVSKITDSVEKQEARLEEKEEDLIQQFAKLESIMSTYSTQASYLSGLLSGSN
jgi:flagellar hook-associated protein 2